MPQFDLEFAGDRGADDRFKIGVLLVKRMEVASLGKFELFLVFNVVDQRVEKIGVRGSE